LTRIIQAVTLKRLKAIIASLKTVKLVFRVNVGIWNKGDSMNNKTKQFSAMWNFSEIGVGHRVELAQAHDTTPLMQLMLSVDRDNIVREALAQNPHIIERAQIVLAKDKEWRVRWMLYRNVHIKPDIRKSINTKR
jgi:hypothetical protein